MKFRTHNTDETQLIATLCGSVFADSEGEAEGALIGKLAANLFELTDDDDLHNYVADDSGQIVGTIFFSRLRFETDIDAFILGPVAVRSDQQGAGIGKNLIRHGLNDLQRRGVEMVLTYGDPAYYQQVGFQQISPATVRAPFELSQPHGWLGQSFTENPIDALAGSCTCVSAFHDPVYW